MFVLLAMKRNRFVPMLYKREPFVPMLYKREPFCSGVKQERTILFLC